MNKRGLLSPKLLSRDERLRIALDVAQIAVWDWDVDANSVFYSQQWKRMRGISGGESYGCSNGLFDSVHPDEKSKREAQKSQWLEGYQDQFHSEYHVEHKSGSWVCVSERVKVVRDSGGNVVRLVGAVSEIFQPPSSQSSRSYSSDGDVVDKTAAIASATDCEQLEQRQEMLTSILESTSDFICVASVDCKMLWCNQRFSKLRPDLDPSGDVNCMDSYSLSSQKIVREIAIPAAIENGIWSGEVTILDSKGEEIPVSQVLIAHKAKDGSVENYSAIMRDIRDLKKASNALHASEVKFTSLVAAMPVAVFELDANGENCVHLNDRWREFSGIAKELGTGNHFLDAIYPQGLPKFRENHLASEKSFETRYLMPDGTTKWFLRQTARMFDLEGSVKGYIATLTNISTQKEAVERLRATKNRLQLVIEGASAGIFEFYPSDGTLIWDDRMMEIHGVSPDEFSGTSEDFYQLLSRADLDRHKEEYEQLLEVGHFTSEFQLTLSSGQRRHVLASQLVVRKDQNEIEKIIGLCIDVTHQRTTQLALHETQTHLQIMTDNIPSMLFRYVRYPDGTQEFPFVSVGAREIYEVEPEDVMEDSSVLLQRIYADDAARIETLINNSFQDLIPFNVEYRILLPEKGLRWAQAMSNPARREGDGAVVWDGFVIDITERKEAEIELQKARMKDEFLANVSHELRTPLNAILGIAEGLQEGVFGPVTLKQLESLKIIKRSGDHLLVLINEMLDLAKVESGQLELVFSSVEVRELCESSLQFVAHQADKKNIQLNLDLPFNIPNINLDEQSIRQVLINLLSNAVKFTPEGGSVSVKVERIASDIRNPEGILRTTVTDTGIGIEAEMLETLFVPFFQVDSSLNRNYEGTGLGLALVKQYVEHHDGKIAVTSELGVGSCFEFTLPYRKPTSHAPAKHQPPIELKRRSTDGNPSVSAVLPPLVLLAEDNEDIAFATSCFLKASGFGVLHATNGAEAVALATEHSPNLILMDIQMPGVDGLEAIRRLRKIPEHQQTPIIAVTGLARQFDTERCLEAGANDYLSKPYRMGDLVKSIQKLLDQRASA